MKNLIGMIAVAMTALSLCGCLHSPETDNTSLTWADFDMGADDLHEGWAKASIDNMPLSCQEPFWTQNPQIFKRGGAKDGRR